MQTFSPFETFPWCSDREMEDYIGTESCVDFGQLQADVVPIDVGRKCRDSNRRLAARREEEKKEFPPAISSPWVLKRYYTGDGRLIIKQENVGRHEYFKVRRANGRLTLQLVPPDDVEEREEDCYGDTEEERDDCCDEEPDPDGDDDDSECEDDDDAVDGCDESDGISGDPMVERAVVETVVRVEREMAVAVGGGAGGGGKCYNSFTGVISRPCLLGMPVVPAIRTVHS